MSPSPSEGNEGQQPQMTALDWVEGLFLCRVLTTEYVNSVRGKTNFHMAIDQTLSEVSQACGIEGGQDRRRDKYAFCIWRSVPAISVSVGRQRVVCVCVRSSRFGCTKVLLFISVVPLL